MAQPIIGITMSLDTAGQIRPGVEYSFIRREYGDRVRAAGGQPVFIDTSIAATVAARLCDGVIISGGADINPAFYGAALANAGEKLEPSERTRWERELIDACDQAHVPILGVCYGSQLLNVHYGGTLIQDLASDRPGSVSHGHSGGAELHDVVFEKKFLGFTAGETAQTAHRHHQAVNQLAPGFRVAAYAPDGTIEAIVGRGHYGIQWHAESDGTAGRIYSAFVARCTPGTLRQALKRLMPETETV